MTFIKRYNNAILSLVLILFSFIWIYLVNLGVFDSFAPPYFLIVAALTPIMDAFAVFFAMKSMKAKESSWAGTILGIIGLLTCGGVLYVAYLIGTY